jgi:alpha-galactosidase
MRLGIGCALLFSSLAGAAPPEAQVEGANIRIEFDHTMHSRVIAKFGGKEIVVGDFAPSEFITVDGKEVKDFVLGPHLSDSMGAARHDQLSGTAPSLQKTIGVTLDVLGFPSMAIFEVQYTNTGTSDLHVTPGRITPTR